MACLYYLLSYLSIRSTTYVFLVTSSTLSWTLIIESPLLLLINIIEVPVDIKIPRCKFVQHK